MAYILNLEDVNLHDVALVGGKNASTGEMIQNLTNLNLSVPRGFAITTHAFRDFIHENRLAPLITKELSKVKVNRPKTIEKASIAIKRAIIRASLSPILKKDILFHAKAWSRHRFAVRSSATLEDLSHASFAGLQETYLNVQSGKSLLQAVKLVYASLYNARAISYRCHQNMPDETVAISVGIQPMVRSDKGCSGVMFTLDPESGFDDVVVINSSYGLGEALVQGSVNPDEFMVYKPALTRGPSAIIKKTMGDKSSMMVYSATNKVDKRIKAVKTPLTLRNQFSLSDNEIITLTQHALAIEKHYKKAMDIEWAKDGVTGTLYIVQARPETVNQDRRSIDELERYLIGKHGDPLITGISVGHKIGAGKATILTSPKQLSSFKKGDVLVTDMTDPDWEPIMKQAAAIVTNRGGRTCHAAIIARELGIPAIVGSQNATHVIKHGSSITVSCAQGEIGFVYPNKIPFKIERYSVKHLPSIPVKLSLNLGNPEMAFINRNLPHAGVGLARLEFIIGSMIGVHPNAILAYPTLPKSLKLKIKEKTKGYQNPKEFYIEKLREGMSQIASAIYPHDVIFRFSDFKSNEYANLIGGTEFEPHEENPMIGFRGASRYVDESFIRCFEMECQAIKRMREMTGLKNAHVMIPFVRTVDELKNVLHVMQKFGLRRGKSDLKVLMMCEVPSNVILAESFLPFVDGFSIGSNDLTQLTLGVDRDSGILSKQFDERDPAVKEMLRKVIKICRRQKKYIGICGQGPSDHPDFALWLMREGIKVLSLNPDTIIDTWLSLSKSGAITNVESVS